MPEFDYEWEILRWTHKDGGSAEGVVRTPSGDEAIIRLGRKIHSEWHWTDPDDQTFEGDGEKGRYIRTRRKAGNLEVRAPRVPEYQRWVDSDFDLEWGFELPDIAGIPCWRPHPHIRCGLRGTVPKGHGVGDQ